MVSATSTLTPESTGTDAPPARSLVALAAKGAGLLAVVAASVFAVCWGVPDGNDYAKATLIKKQALMADVPRKIVLVGGSNLAFGVDSSVIAKATGCPVANMGMNGYFGVKFMMSEAAFGIRAGDVVVVAWEYDNYYKSADGSAPSLMAATKTDPSAFGRLDLGQKLAVIGVYPEIAQYKVLRLITEARHGTQSLLGVERRPLRADELLTAAIRRVEVLSGFTPTGDLVSHIGVDWPYEREYGLDLVNLEPDQEIIPLTVDFVEDMDARGAATMISFTPVIDYYYNDQKREIDRISAEFQANPKLKVPRPASDFVFPPSQHFDTVYHLNAEGRAIRSRMLADDILATFGDRARCNTTKPAT